MYAIVHNLEFRQIEMGENRNAEVKHWETERKFGKKKQRISNDGFSDNYELQFCIG